MRRPVLGIIAVICLHLAFVAFTSNDDPTIIALNAETPDSVPYTATSVEYPRAALLRAPAVPVATSPVEELARIPVGPAVYPTKRTMKASAPIARKPRTVPVRALAGNTSIKARYKPPVASSPVPESTYSVKVRYEPRTEFIAITKKDTKSKKRSLFGRIVPIVKKPYDWLKAVGSKLK